MQCRLQIQYDGKQVELGNELLPREVRFGPRVTFGHVDPEAIYSLLMIGAFQATDRNRLTRLLRLQSFWNTLPAVGVLCTV